MATPVITPPPPQTSVRRTTSRGIATVSFSLGLWGTMIFWWYPIGMIFATVGLLLGLLSLARGIRVAGQPHDNLAFAGVVMGATGLTAGLLVYRGMQFFFENKYWFNMP